MGIIQQAGRKKPLAFGPLAMSAVGPTATPDRPLWFRLSIAADISPARNLPRSFFLQLERHEAREVVAFLSAALAQGAES